MTGTIYWHGKQVYYHNQHITVNSNDEVNNQNRKSEYIMFITSALITKLIQRRNITWLNTWTTDAHAMKISTMLFSFLKA